MSTRVDYLFIENALRDTWMDFRSAPEYNTFSRKINELRRKYPDLKLFLVIGGSYSERMMTPHSDIEFWLFVFSERMKSLEGYKDLNRIFKKMIADPFIRKVQTRYPDMKLCMHSVKSFAYYTEGALRIKDYKRRKRRISGGLTVITFGRVVEVPKEPLLGSTREFLEVRRKFKEFWEAHGEKLYEIYGLDKISNSLERALRNLRQYKGKSLYRVVQLAVRTICEAYGMPEKVSKQLDLKEKLIGWCGRPRFARHQLVELIDMIDHLRHTGKRVSELGEDFQRKLQQKLELFKENLYEPFKKWYHLRSALINIFEKQNIKVQYIGFAKTHIYIIFRDNMFSHIKGVDIEQENDDLVFLANIGRPKNKKVLSEVLRYKHIYPVFTEIRDEYEEVFHKELVNLSEYKFWSRIHLLIARYSVTEIANEDERLSNQLFNKLKEIDNIIEELSKVSSNE